MKKKLLAVVFVLTILLSILSPVCFAENEEKDPDHKIKVGLLYDWDNRWDLDMAQGFQRDNKKVLPTLQQYYNALWSKGISQSLG